MMSFYISGNAPFLYPTDTYFGIFRYEGSDFIEIPKFHPFQEEWGNIITTNVIAEKNHVPIILDLVYLSIIERKFYSVESRINTELIENLWAQIHNNGAPLFSHIIVGMAPYGETAIWVRGGEKSVLIDWIHAEEILVEMKDFLPMNPTMTLDKFCDFFIDNDPIVKQNLATNGLPPRDLFDNYMKQFTYRYLPMFEHWNEDEEKWQKYTEDEQETKPVFDYIEEALYDGTHDKLHDGGLMQYHEAGKPKKLAMKWHINNSEYAAYFWLEDDAIRAIFDKFYGIHPDTKTDFIIHIDSEKKKYQLALFRYGLQEPKIISEDAYQLIVFKNKFEQYRSTNYKQPRGAWIW